MKLLRVLILFKAAAPPKFQENVQQLEAVQSDEDVDFGTVSTEENHDHDHDHEESEDVVEEEDEEMIIYSKKRKKVFDLAKHLKQKNNIIGGKIRCDSNGCHAVGESSSDVADL